MKTILSLAVLVFVSVVSVSGQEADPTKFSPVEVAVTDFNNVPKQGEQILFEGVKTKTIYKGITDANGKFTLHIKGGDEYLIKIQSIGDAEDYSTFKIPSLNPGEMYATTRLTIQIETPKYFTLDNVHFESAKSSLRADSYAELEELVEYMQLKKGLVIEIAGHTDNVGEDAANLTLSQARANTVKSYLVSKGIAADRIVAKGYGESRPIATNDTAEGRQQNRRTEVHIIKEG